MNIKDLQLWVETYPLLGFGGLLLLSFALFIIARAVVARGLVYLSSRTKTKVDDLVVKHLRPFRVVWLAPLVLIYSQAYLWPGYQTIIERASLLLILWISAFTVNSLITVMNVLYEASPGFSGVSIQGYLDICKIFILLVALILSVSLVTGESPAGLLTGLGALTAVLLLVFRDTILSLVASIQISSHDLVKEGDWLEVPSYEADGDVVNMSLHSIKIQNWDKTFSVIPTYKITEVAFRNWRGMQESGGRRIKRALYIDLNSIKMCSREMIERFRRVDILQEYLDAKLLEIEGEIQAKGIELDSPLDGRQLTNVGTFRAYIEAYLRNHPAIYKSEMTFLVRQLAPSPTGLPLEVYVFTTTTDWIEYERIQADIFDHLLAAVPHFDLRVFQEPTGSDFANLAQM